MAYRVLKNRGVFVALSVSFTQLFFSPVRAEECSPRARVKANDVRLRALPQKNGRIIRLLKAGETFPVRSAADGWQEWVGEGFVASALVDVSSGDCALAFQTSKDHQATSAAAKTAAPETAPGVVANQELTDAMARGAIALGEYDRASEILERHLEKDPRDTRASALLAELRSRREQSNDDGSGLRVRGTFRVGYDSNVLLLPDQSVGASPGSAFISPGVSVEKPFSIAGESFRARSQSSYLAHASKTVQTLNAFNQSIGAEWSPQENDFHGWALASGTRFDVSAVNSDGLEWFNYSPSVYVNGVQKIDSTSAVVVELPVAYQRFPGVTVTSSADSRNGWTISPTALYKKQLEQFSLTGGGGYQEAFTTGSNFRSRAVNALIAATRPIGYQFTARSGASWVRTWYPKNAFGRSDRRLDLSAGVLRPLPFDERLSLSLDYQFSKNHSRLATASYDRHTVFLELAFLMK